MECIWEKSFLQVWLGKSEWFTEHDGHFDVWLKLEKKARAHGKELFFIITFNKIFLGEEKMKTGEDKRTVKLEFF